MRFSVKRMELNLRHRGLFFQVKMRTLVRCSASKVNLLMTRKNLKKTRFKVGKVGLKGKKMRQYMNTTLSKIPMKASQRERCKLIFHH